MCTLVHVYAEKLTLKLQGRYPVLFTVIVRFVEKIAALHLPQMVLLMQMSLKSQDKVTLVSFLLNQVEHAFFVHVVARLYTAQIMRIQQEYEFA